MKVPNHVAIILDGNGRWAKAKGMPRTYGHIKGCENLEKICSIAKELGVKYLTVYAFSTENWKRSREEVDGLMKLFRNYMKKCIKISAENKMRVRVIGDPRAFDEDLQKKIQELEEYSSQYDELHFQIALNYGSRDENEKSHAAHGRRSAERKSAAGRDYRGNHFFLSGYQGTAGSGPLIRTSGEERLSNFLMWQLAYTEFYFTDVPWPDFNKQEFERAIDKYNHRERRYGGVKEE